jgi:hypothetical protein
MGKQEIQKQNASTRFRAVCTEGDFKGEWGDEKSAKVDADAHTKADPGHIVEIEFEQRGTFSIK